MTVSLFDHPVMSALFSCEEISDLFSFQAELDAMLLFESKLAQVEAELGVISDSDASEIMKACAKFEPDHEKMRKAVAADGLVVPELIRQLKASLSVDVQKSLHHGATSQDVIDSGLVLRLGKAIELMSARLNRILNQLRALDKDVAGRTLNARTRMQVAYPMAVSDRIQTWLSPLQSASSRLSQVKKDLLLVQFGGAIGNLRGLEEKGPLIRARLAEELGLSNPGRSWHVDRFGLRNFANWMSDVSIALGKIGTDISLMAVNEVEEVKMAGGGTSSAMPHKQNPVKAELLITLARNAALHAGGMQHAGVHEFERSGANWSLEWLLLPEIVMNCFSSLSLTEALLSDVEELGRS